MDHLLSGQFNREFRPIPNAYNQWPTHHWQKIPNPHVSRADSRPRLAPTPFLRSAFSMDKVVRSCDVPVQIIRNPRKKPEPVESFVRIFEDFHSGKGPFRSRVVRDRGLSMKLTNSEFLVFRKLLRDRDEDSDR